MDIKPIAAIAYNRQKKDGQVSVTILKKAKLLYGLEVEIHPCGQHLFDIHAVYVGRRDVVIIAHLVILHVRRGRSFSKAPLIPLNV